MIALFFDTETTGVKSWKTPGFIPRLVQIGAILQDLETGRVLAEINLISDPRVPIPAGASAVHGITDDMAERFGHHIEEIDQLFYNLLWTTEILIAHNIVYDLDILADNMPMSSRLIGTRKDFTFCTMKASTNVVQAPFSAKQIAFFKDRPDKKDGDFKAPNLTETYQHFFGEPFDGAHDAMADIRACRDIFLELIKTGHYQIGEGAIVETAKMLELRKIKP